MSIGSDYNLANLGYPPEMTLENKNIKSLFGFIQMKDYHEPFTLITWHGRFDLQLGVGANKKICENENTWAERVIIRADYEASSKDVLDKLGWSDLIT